MTDSTIGFLFNFAEGTVSRHPFFLYRYAPMYEYLSRHGIALFVYSPRHVDRDNGLVRGFVREGGKFVETVRRVPDVNGNWYIGHDRSIVAGGMGGRKFRAWARQHGVELYPDADFTDQLRDKFLTYRLFSDLDPALHPHTELFRDGAAQLQDFLTRSDKVFLKPTLGNKGNRIVVVSRKSPGLAVDYYDHTEKHSAEFADCAAAMSHVRPLMGAEGYVIQAGIPLAEHQRATFILRVIMLHDGERWHWVHKAVLAAADSEIANTTQGGSNHATEEFLARVYGDDALGPLMDEVRQVCFDTVERMDQAYGHGLMEVAYDLVIDDARRARILEVNTRPGMTKPGLPMSDAFGDIFKRNRKEQRLYRQFVQPHGAALAKFLHTRLLARQQQPAARVSTLGQGAGNKRGAARAPGLQLGIRRATAYLAGACGEDGMFRYRVNLDASIELKPRYHTGRHAGAMHALAARLARESDAGALAALQRASVFLRERCVASVDELASCSAVWSLPGLETRSRDAAVKTGNVGLALYAFDAALAHAPGLIGLDRLRELGNYLLASQLPDGRMVSNYRPARGGFVDRPVAAQASGEAALGLATLFGQDPDPRWIEAALRALAFLARSRRDLAVVPADRCSLLAIGKVIDAPPSYEQIVTRQELIDYAAQVCESILREQFDGKDARGRSGGFSADGLIAPTVERLECALAALSLLPPTYWGLRERLVPTIRRGVDFLLRTQVRDGDYQGGMPRAAAPLPLDRARAERFNRRAGEVRIDTVQLALSVLLGFQREFAGQGRRRSAK